MFPSLEDILRKTVGNVDVYETTSTPEQGRDFVPAPLADEFIDWVHDLNYLRQICRTTRMTSLTKTYPRLLSAPRVFYQSLEGGTGTYTNITSDNIVLTAKKLMSLIRFSTEILEDASFDMREIVEGHFAKAVADAEEEAMMIGNPNYATTTATIGDETATTWYEKSHKLAFWGMLHWLQVNTIHGAQHVNAGGADMDVSVIRTALYKMGKYGRVFQNLILVLNSFSANQLIGDSNLHTLEKYGPNATIFTGEIGKLYGKIRVINSAYCQVPGVSTGEGFMFHRENPIIGDRRALTLKAAEWIDDDVIKVALTERLAFSWDRNEAMVYIHGLKSPTTLAS